MKNIKILILGGYGVTGPYIARLLLQETGCKVILAGRNPDKAKGLADVLNNEFKGSRVSALRVDASDEAGMKRAFRKVDFVIVAAATSGYVEGVARAALEAGTDYLDIQYSSRKTAILYSMADEIEKAGRCFITEAGSSPGLPAAVIRYAANFFDEITEAHVGVMLRQKGGQKMRGAVYEMVESFKEYEALKYKSGRWKKAPLMGLLDSRRFDFGEPFPKKTCVPVVMEEMKKIPEILPSLKKVGMYMAGYNWLVDGVITPFIMLVLKLFPERGVKPMARLLQWGTTKFDKPPYGTIIKTDAVGVKDGKRKKLNLRIFHRDGYFLTAAPVAAAIKQYIDGTIRKPGVHMPGHVVDIDRFLKDLKSMGVEIAATSVTEKQ